MSALFVAVAVLIACAPSALAGALLYAYVRDRRYWRRVVNRMCEDAEMWANAPHGGHFQGRTTDPRRERR